jgi:hypothetical protein
MNTHLTSVDLIEIFAAINQDRIDREVLDKLSARIKELKEFEERSKEDERRRSEAVPQVVPNFKEVKVGTVVVRSEHYKKECTWSKKTHDQIGMIVEMQIFEDDLCLASYWPVVHWEGEHSSSINHPLNVACKDGRILPTTTMNANQQSRKK